MTGQRADGTSDSLVFHPQTLLWLLLPVLAAFFLGRGIVHGFQGQSRAAEMPALANEVSLILADRQPGETGTFTVTNKHPYLTRDGISLTLPAGTEVSITTTAAGACARAKRQNKIYWLNSATGAWGTTRPPTGPCAAAAVPTAWRTP